VGVSRDSQKAKMIKFIQGEPQALSRLIQHMRLSHKATLSLAKEVAEDIGFSPVKQPVLIDRGQYRESRHHDHVAKKQPYFTTIFDLTD